MNIDIFGILSTIVVPVLIAHIRLSKVKQTETVVSISELQKSVGRLAGILGNIADAQASLNNHMTHDHEEHAALTLRLVSIETKLDNTATSVSQLHTRLDK